MSKVLIEIILTNRCNKRCEYCDLNFINKSLSFSDIDLLIKFLRKDKAEYTINFFGGEPLLEYDKIQYFIKNGSQYCKRIFVGTNGVLLNKEKLSFFEINNIQLLVTVDNIFLGKDIDLELLALYNNIKINFVNDPDYLLNSIKLYEILKIKGFRTIAFMPIFATKKRTKNKLLYLKKIFNYVKINSSGINLEVYSYFNGFTADKQFILDTDKYFYSDFDGHLWLQKQYSNTNKDLVEKINNETKLLNLKDINLSLDRLLCMYNLKNILKLFFLIPKSTGDLTSYKIIDDILENDNKVNF